MNSTKARNAVNKAVKEGILLPVKTLICVDCGKKAACYDHRDYDKPLDVVPVCVSCNLRRGPAKGVNNNLKAVQLEHHINAKLNEIAAYREKNHIYPFTKKDIVAVIVNEGYKKMLKDKTKDAQALLNEDND